METYLIKIMFFQVLEEQLYSKYLLNYLQFCQDFAKLKLKES